MATKEKAEETPGKIFENYSPADANILDILQELKREILSLRKLVEQMVNHTPKPMPPPLPLSMSAKENALRERNRALRRGIPMPFVADHVDAPH